jgi:Ca-activated chloride channel family protein
MQPQLSFDRTLLTVRDGEILHVMLELTAPPAVRTERKPLDIVVVLDRSGSMSGAPLEAVTRATAQLLRLAAPDDRIGVVAFDDTVELVLPLAHHEATAAGRRVREVRAGGSTNLSAGWLKGLEMLVASPRPEALRRVIVLTDGHANAGIVGQDNLVSLVKSGHAQSITTSFIGFDDGYDEQLLTALADAGRGNEYWCDGPDQAAAVFADEFQGLASVVAQNISVELTPTAQVATATILNEFPITDIPGGGVQVALGDAYGEEVRRVVAAFHLRPIIASGPVDVATLTIRWAATADEVALHTVTLPVTVTAGTDPVGHDPGADPRVHEEVLVLQAARTRKEAREAAERGDFTVGSALLMESARLLSSSASPNVDMIDELRMDADQLSRAIWSAKDSKRQWARAQSVQRGRRTDYDVFEKSDPDADPDAGTNGTNGTK